MNCLVAAFGVGEFVGSILGARLFSWRGPRHTYIPPAQGENNIHARRGERGDGRPQRRKPLVARLGQVQARGFERVGAAGRAFALCVLELLGAFVLGVLELLVVIGV